MMLNLGINMTTKKGINMSTNVAVIQYMEDIFQVILYDFYMILYGFLMISIIIVNVVDIIVIIIIFITIMILQVGPHFSTFLVFWILKFRCNFNVSPDY